MGKVRLRAEGHMGRCYQGPVIPWRTEGKNIWIKLNIQACSLPTTTANAKTRWWFTPPFDCWCLTVYKWRLLYPLIWKGKLSNPFYRQDSLGTQKWWRPWYIRPQWWWVLVFHHSRVTMTSYSFWTCLLLRWRSLAALCWVWSPICHA